MTALYRCTTCGRGFDNAQQLGGHRSRSTCIPIAGAIPPAAPAIPAPAAPAIPAPPVAPAIPETPVTPVQFSITQLLQRPVSALATHRVVAVPNLHAPRQCEQANTYRLHEVII